MGGFSGEGLYPLARQSDDFGHGGELIFRARASPCNMLRNMLRNMLHGTA
jgi:hypothetical protein